MERRTTFTAQEKRECAEREVGMRKRLYSRWISEGRISGMWADREIALMEEILEDYRELERGERLL